MRDGGVRSSFTREVPVMNAYRSRRSHYRLVLWATVLALILLISAHTPAHAVAIFTASLDQSQENPPTGSPATGLGVFVLNDAMTQLQFGVTFAGLVAPFIAAHFHVGPPGVNGPIVRGMLPAESTIFPGGMFGFFVGVWSSTDAEPLTPALVTALFGGNIYFNIHSTAFPGGEIRGQLNQVPEPASLLLVGSGLTALGVVAWRRARRK
jgi:hypothetical protein